MRNSTRYWCVVPAAGVGKRMGSDIPKQYLPLGNSTVIQQTLVKLRKIRQLEAVVLCLSSGDEWWASLSDNLSDKHNLDNDPPVIIAAGGKERSDSVLNGLKALTGKASENDWVLVHDVARPCVRVDDIRTLIERASQHNVGGLLGMPVRDTMKRATVIGVDGVDGVEVQRTVCRDNLWHALTPQMFRYGDLMHAMTDALNANAPITDEASALERLGKQPLLVEGHPDNIKITHPEDLALAALFLKQQASL